MRVEFVGTDTSPCRLLYEQDVNRIRSKPAPTRLSPSPPSVLLQTIRARLSGTVREESLIPTYHSVVAPLPVPSPVKRDPLEPTRPVVEEEIAWWGNKVAWSKGSSVFRTFSYEHERENVRFALFAWFTDSENDGTGSGSRRGGPGEADSREHGLHATAPAAGQVGAQPSKNAFGPFASSFGAAWRGKRNLQVSDDRIQAEPTTRLQRCLVVFLEKFVYFYSASGETKVTALPRLVEEAWGLQAGGLLIRMSLPDGPSGRGRDKQSARDVTADENTDSYFHEQADKTPSTGLICSLSRPGDRFRPVLIDHDLELARTAGTVGMVALSRPDATLQDVPAESCPIFVAPEELGIIVCHDSSANQIVFLRYGRRAPSSALDEWEDDAFGETMQSITDPLDRNTRTRGVQQQRIGRKSVGGESRHRISLAGLPSGAHMPSRSAVNERTQRFDKPRTLTEGIVADEIDLTVMMGTIASQGSLSPSIVCQEVYRFDLGPSRVPSGGILVFLSGGRDDGSACVNVHVTDPAGSLLRFDVKVASRASSLDDRLQLQIAAARVMPCQSAQPVSARPGAGVEVLLTQASTLEAPHWHLVNSADELALLHVPQSQSRIMGDFETISREIPSFRNNEGSAIDSAGNTFSLRATSGPIYKFCLVAPTRCRLLQQIYIAAKLCLASEASEVVCSILEASEARSSDEVASTLRRIVEAFAATNASGAGGLPDSTNDLEVYLASMSEPDLRTNPPRTRDFSVQQTMSQADHAEASVLDVLSLLHWVGQDCLLDTSRHGDLALLAPEIGRLAECAGHSSWVDYWWRLLPMHVQAGKKNSAGLRAGGSESEQGPPDILGTSSQILRRGSQSVLPDSAELRQAYPASASYVAVLTLLAGHGSGQEPLSKSLDVATYLANHQSARSLVRSLPWALRLPMLEALQIERTRASRTTDPKVLLVTRRFDLLAQHHAPRRQVTLDRRELFQREVRAQNDLVSVPPLSSTQTQILLEIAGPTVAAARRSLQTAPMAGTERCDILEDYRSPEAFTTLPKFRFVIDRRLEDIERLLQTHRPRTIKVDYRPEITAEQRIDHEEKVVVQHAQRALSRLVGQGILSYASKDIARNTVFHLPVLELAIRIVPSMDLRLPAYAKLQADVAGWPSFNNGVVAGLTVRPSSRNVDSSWIAAHRRTVPPTEIGGFLLGLGLNGHLTQILNDNIVEWLAPRYDQTSVGLLLGMAASFAGSQSEDITRFISANLPCLLPGGSLELNTSPIVQAASFMGIGMVHASSGKNRFAAVALNEIGRQLLPGIESLAEYREAYSFSAACAFGLIMLGRGGTNPAMDSQYVPRLRAYCDSSQAVGGGGGFADDIDHDVTAPGATLALGLMFLRTGRSDISDLLPLPTDIFGLDHIRPDLLLVRTLSRALVHWEAVEPTVAWIEAQIPPFILSAWKDRLRIKPKETVELAYIYIMTGACLAMAIRYAGTLNDVAYRLLHSQVKAFADPHGGTLSYEARNRRGAMRQAQSLIAIALGLVVAGSGDLTAYRRIRFLLGTESGNYAWRTALNISAGLLFMGTGRYTFGSSNMAVAAMCIAFFPRFAAQADHNYAYLQAYRHMWAMAVEPRCVITGDIDSLSTVYMPLKLEANGIKGPSPKQRTVISPALLSTYDNISAVSVGSPRYHNASVMLGDSPSTNALIKSQVMFVKRKTAYVDYIADPKGHRTLNMLAGPLFNNAVDGILGHFGGSSPVSPDIVDLPALVTEHTASPFVNALVGRLGAPLDPRSPVGKTCTSDWTWPMLLLRNLLEDRVESLPLEITMVMSIDFTSGCSGMVALRMAKCALFYYALTSKATRSRISAGKADSVDPVIYRLPLESAIDRFSTEEGHDDEPMSLTYFLGVARESPSNVEASGVEVARYLAAHNVPDLATLDKLRKHLTLAHSRMMLHSAQSKDDRRHVLRWLARRKLSELGAGVKGDSADTRLAAGQEPVWDDASMMSAVSAWFP